MTEISCPSCHCEINLALDKIAQCDSCGRIMHGECAEHHNWQCVVLGCNGRMILHPSGNISIEVTGKDANEVQNVLLAALKQMLPTHLPNRVKSRENIESKIGKSSCSLFISYSREDAQFATRLATDMRATGADTWRDAENIPAGTNWDREIEKAIHACTHVIFVATPSSVESENVQDELSMAVNKKKTVIPVMLETCELPLRVHRAQWVDFRGEYEPALQKLVEQLSLTKDD